MFSLFSVSSQAHMVPTGPEFLVTYRRGAKWDDSKEFKNQKGIGEHIQYMKKLYHGQKIKFAGVGEKQEERFFVFKGLKKQELEKLINQDKAVAQQILNAKIQAFTTIMKEKSHSH